MNGVAIYFHPDAYTNTQTQTQTQTKGVKTKGVRHSFMN